MTSGLCTAVSRTGDRQRQTSHILDTSLHRERTETSAWAWEIIDMVREVLGSLWEPQLVEVAALETPDHCVEELCDRTPLEAKHLLEFYGTDFPSPGAVFVFSELERRGVLRPVWEC